MQSMSVRALAASAIIVSAVSLGACSSGGGGTPPSESTVQTALLKDSSYKSEIGDMVPAAAKGKVAECIAQEMIKDVPASQLNAYIAGKKTLDDLTTATSSSDVSGSVQSCVTAAVGGSSSSSSPSS
jgi:hypothetical protein